MAVEKDKVVAVLKAKLKGKSHTKTFIESVAKRYADKIENEDGIDEYVDDRLDDLIEAGAEADRRAAAAAKKAKEDAAKAISGDDTKTEDPEPIDDPTMPTWAKTLIKQNQELAATVTKLQAEKHTETITDRFKKDERLKGIPEFAFKGRIPTSEEDFENAVTELANDFKPFIEQNKGNGGFGSDTPKFGGNNQQPAGGGSGKVDPAILKFAEQNNKTQTSTKS